MEFTISLRSPISFARQSHTNPKAQGTQHTTAMPGSQTRRREPTLQPNHTGNETTPRKVHANTARAGHHMEPLPNSTGQAQIHQCKTCGIQPEAENRQNPIGVFASDRQGSFTNGSTYRQKRKAMGLPKTKIVFLGVLLFLLVQFFGAIIFKENYINQLLGKLTDIQLSYEAMMAVTIAGIYTSLHLILEKYLYPFLLLVILVLAAVVYGSI